MSFTKSIALAIAAAAGTPTMDARATTLVVEYRATAQPAIGEAVNRWCMQASTVTKERLRCAPAREAAEHTDLLTRIREGTIDLTVIAHRDYPKAFPLSRIADLPRLGDFAETVSSAYQRTYELSPELAKEHRSMKVIAVFTQPPGHLVSSESPTKVAEQLRGRPVVASGDFGDRVARALGMLAPATSRQDAAKGLYVGRWQISNATEVLGSVDTPKLRSALVVPGGVSNVSYVFAMSDKAWAALSPEDRRSVDGISGDSAARAFGRSLDSAEWKANMKERTNGMIFYSLDDQGSRRLNSHLKSLDRSWSKAAQSAGSVRPDRALVTFRKTISDRERAE